MTNPFGHNPFERNPFETGPPGAQFAPPPAPPPPPRDEVNALATLSLVFAFVFAPAGAVLGQLGLSQIRRTGERGRDRALVGVTLSYVFITVAVVALVVGATLAARTTTRTATPTTTSANPTTTTATTPPRPPIVTPSGLPGLLPTLDDVKNSLGIQNLVAEPPIFQLIQPSLGVDRRECLPVIGGGDPSAYDMPAVVGFYALTMNEPRDGPALQETGLTVSALRDATAAQRQLVKSLSIWRQCGGSTMTLLPAPGWSKPATISMSVPADAGNGITTMVVTARGPLLRSRNDRAIAAKNNVLVDINVEMVNTDRGQQAALDIANSILAKIPG